MSVKTRRNPQTGQTQQNRKIIVHVAISADWYIARPDGDVGWLDRPMPKGSYGMGAFFKTVDTILWGRKTYSKGIEMGMKDAAMWPGMKNYVFSHRPPKSPLPGFEFVDEPIKPFIKRLRSERGKHIWMMGGGSRRLLAVLGAEAAGVAEGQRGRRVGAVGALLDRREIGRAHV